MELEQVNIQEGVKFPKLAKISAYSIGLLLTAESAILYNNIPENKFVEQRFSISIEATPVIANIETTEIITRSTLIPESTGVLPAEVTQPECVKSPIAWLPETVSRWHPYVAETAKKFEIPPTMLDILMLFETLGDPEITSNKGAEGLIQILPSTAIKLADQLGIPGPNLRDPVTNIYLSGQYIRNVLNTGLVDLSQGFNAESAKRVAIAYHGGDSYLKIYAHGGIEALAEMPKTRRYAERVAQAWDEQNLPTSQAFNDLMALQGPQNAMVVASQRGTAPC